MPQLPGFVCGGFVWSNGRPITKRCGLMPLLHVLPGGAAAPALPRCRQVKAGLPRANWAGLLPRYPERLPLALPPRGIPQGAPPDPAGRPSGFPLLYFAH